MNQLQYNTGAFRAPRTRETHSKKVRAFGIVFSVVMEGAIIYALLVNLGFAPAPPVLHHTEVTFFPDVTVVDEVSPPPAPIITPPAIPDAFVPTVTLDYVPPQEHAITPPPQRQVSLTPPPAITYSPAQALLATHTTPEYPALSRRLREEGTLRLRLTITAGGAVETAMVEQSSGFSRLDQAAVDWVKGHWRYAPAMRGSTPVPSIAVAVVTFKLQ